MFQSIQVGFVQLVQLEGTASYADKKDPRTLFVAGQQGKADSKSLSALDWSTGKEGAQWPWYAAQNLNSRPWTPDPNVKPDVKDNIQRVNHLFIFRDSPQVVFPNAWDGVAAKDKNLLVKGSFTDSYTLNIAARTTQDKNGAGSLFFSEQVAPWSVTTVRDTTLVNFANRTNISVTPPKEWAVPKEAQTPLRVNTFPSGLLTEGAPWLTWVVPGK